MKNNNDISYNFTSFYTRELLKLAFDRNKYNTTNLFVRLILSCLMVLIASVIIKYKLIIIISLILLGIMIICYIIVIIAFNNIVNKLIESPILNSELNTTIYNDHIFINSINKSGQGTVNLEWNDFKSYDEYKNVMIMTNKLNQMYIFDKSIVHSVNALNFIRAKMLQNVKIFMCKKVKYNKPITYYIKDYNL